MYYIVLHCVFRGLYTGRKNSFCDLRTKNAFFKGVIAKLRETARNRNRILRPYKKNHGRRKNFIDRKIHPRGGPTYGKDTFRNRIRILQKRTFGLIFICLKCTRTRNTQCSAQNRTTYRKGYDQVY